MLLLKLRGAEYALVAMLPYMASVLFHFDLGRTSMLALPPLPPPGPALPFHHVAVPHAPLLPLSGPAASPFCTPQSVNCIT